MFSIKDGSLRMTKVTRQTEYALIALKHIASRKSGQITPTGEIAEIYGCSFDMLARVLRRLVQKQILKGVQGVQGGYLMARPLSQISIYDVLEAVEGKSQLVACLKHTERSCELRPTCNIISPIHQLSEKMISFYRKLNLEDLFADRATPGKVSIDGAPAYV